MRLMIAALSALVATVSCSAQEPVVPPQQEAAKADFSGYGPYRIGMSADEVRKAGDSLAEGPADPAAPCHFFTDPRAKTRPGQGLSIQFTKEGGDHVTGIEPPDYTATTRGLAFGKDKAEIFRAYADEEVTEDYFESGKIVLVKDNESGNYLGFSLGPDEKTITSIRIGTKEFAAAFETCVGG